MKNILFIQGSPRNAESHSQRVARSIVDDLAKRCRDAKVTVPIWRLTRHRTSDWRLSAVLLSPREQQTPQQAEALALSDQLVDELTAADVLVMAVPMHNFGIPSTLKAWIDHVARAGRTFAYTHAGPQGLLKGKRTILVLATGGVYSSGPTKAFDFQEPYLRAILGFLGITDVNVVRVEGVAGAPSGRKRQLAPQWNSRKKFSRASRVIILSTYLSILKGITMKIKASNQRSPKAKHIALWSLQVLIAAAFLMAGFAKLSGQPMMVEVYEKIGVGQWFRYVTGSIEVVSAILLLIPRLTPVGSALLVCTMIGAVATHLFIIGGSPVPPLVLGCLAAVILWCRFSVVTAWFARRPKESVASTAEQASAAIVPSRRR